MITETRRSPRPPSTLVILLAVALLVVGYGDGLAAGLQSRFNLPSPWIVIFAALLVLLAGYTMVAKLGLAATDVFQIEVVLWFFGLGLALQLLLHGTINVAGYIQLALFIVALILVRALFARAPDHLVAALGPSILLAHVFLSGYVLTAWLTWNLTGVDIDVRRLLDSSVPVVANAYYGYRPAAWSAEPAWAALALSVSFSAVYYLMPSARQAALALTAVAALALQSGTLFLFISVVVCGLLARRHARLAILPGVLVVAALLVITLRSDRIEAVIQGRDPSLMMRSASASVAIDVVSRSFPIGVGYGNFRDYAAYGADFAPFLDLSMASFYKSDVMILNFAAELGLGGLLLIAYVFRLLGFGRFLMPTIFLAMQAVTAGTLLVPALLVLAAVRGRQDRLEQCGHLQEASGIDQRPAHLTGQRGLRAIRTRRNWGMDAPKDAESRLAACDSGTTADTRSRP